MKTLKNRARETSAGGFDSDGKKSAAPSSMSDEEFQSFCDKVVEKYELPNDHSDLERLSRSQWDKLKTAVRVRKNQKLFSSGLDGGRDGAISTLRHIGLIIPNRVPELRKYVPIIQAIEFALIDRARGLNPEMLQRNTESDVQGEERRATIYDQWIQGASAAAVTLMRQQQPEQKIEEIYDNVAKEFNKAGWRKTSGRKSENVASSQIKAITIENWRKKMMRSPRDLNGFTDESVSLYELMLDCYKDVNYDEILPIIVGSLKPCIPRHQTTDTEVS